MVIRAWGIHKVLVRIANREDPDQTAFSDMYGIWAMWCLHISVDLPLDLPLSLCCSNTCRMGYDMRKTAACLLRYRD